MKRETILSHYRKAVRLAVKETERRARKILKAHPNLHEFVMAMGTFGFWDKNDNKVDGCAYMKPLENFVGQWDDVLKITGHPMRFTAKGPVVTDW